MSGRCCPGQDDGNGIVRAANPGVAVTGITQRFSPAPFLDRPDQRGKALVPVGFATLADATSRDRVAENLA